MIPRFKFNNGNGTLLCCDCNKIIQTPITEEQAKNSNLYFCEKCLDKRYSIYLEMCTRTRTYKSNIANKDYFKKFITMFLTYQPKKRGRHKIKHKIPY